MKKRFDAFTTKNVFLFVILSYHIPLCSANLKFCGKSRPKKTARLLTNLADTFIPIQFMSLTSPYYSHQGVIVRRQRIIKIIIDR